MIGSRSEREPYVRFDNAQPDSEECLRLSGEKTDYRVNGSSRTPHRAMCDILRSNRSVLRHVSRRANRARLNATGTNGEREND